MTYSAEDRNKIVDGVCERLVRGESLRSICLSEEMPAMSTFLSWVDEDKDFQSSIARARNLQAEAIFDDITDLTNRMLEEDLDHNKVKTAIWAKQWQASKLKPKKYGDKLDVEHSGDVATSLTVSFK